MKKQIRLNNKKINYILKTSKRAKRLRLSIHCSGSFVVTKPSGLNENIVRRYLKDKANWILSKLDYFKKVKNDYLKNDVKNYLANKQKARQYISDRVIYFNNKYGYEFNRISIKNQKTRWGSCSSKGNLNFNYRIIFLSKKMSDYVIVHELCHLKEFSHSKDFWNLVAIEIPDYRNIRKELRNRSILKRNYNET